MQDMTAQCFQKDTKFVSALKAGFEAFVNENEKLSRMLAAFINEVLTRGNTVSLNEPLDKTLDNGKCRLHC